MKIACLFLMCFEKNSDLTGTDILMDGGCIAGYGK